MVHNFNHSHMDNIQICLDIPFIDHPYLIGPRGRKCQHLMERYRSLIHFPDCNRRQGGPKVNNVLISGSMKCAEEVRLQLRNRTPIRLAVQLQCFSDVRDLMCKMEAAIADRSLPIRINCSDDLCTGMLKTEWRNQDILVKFCDEFLSRPKKASGNMEVFTLAETVLPLINPWNAELSHSLIEYIYSSTGCRVFYPPKEKFADQPPSYFIKGESASNVLEAAKFITGMTMFQVSFAMPHSFQVSRELFEEWQNKFLVHTSFEPVYKQNNEFSHEKVTLRSFEFCVNSVYIVRSILLGFKKTVQTSSYNFMSDVKQMIPGSVFSAAQLYFPLYAIDDERSFDWNLAGADFFKNFYGGPYSTRRYEQYNEDLTSRLQAIMKISSDTDDFNNNTGNESAAPVAGQTQSQNHTVIDGSFDRSKGSTLLVSHISPGSIEFARASPPTNNQQSQKPSSPNNQKQYREFRSQRSQNSGNNCKPLASRASQLMCSADGRFSCSTPIVAQKRANLSTLPFLSSGTASPLMFISSVAATSTAVLEHEDDPELQAILRRSMPCLEVTEKQVQAIDHEMMNRALMTGDAIAVMSDPFHRSFNYAEYSVSHPAQVSVQEYNKQFGNSCLSVSVTIDSETWHLVCVLWLLRFAKKLMAATKGNQLAFESILY
uniref:K Homology domain-containing protein n=1 Tax=Ditylenchus dipsaci TaxID=166011 RepID=A0A915E196_9BILA